MNAAAHHLKPVKIKHNQQYYRELMHTPRAEPYTLHFHQMHCFQPKALYVLPKLDTKHVSAPQVRANGLGLGNRHEDTSTDPEYIWLLYKQSTLVNSVMCQRSHRMKSVATPDVISYCQEGSIKNSFYLFVLFALISSPLPILYIRLSLTVYLSYSLSLLFFRCDCGCWQISCSSYLKNHSPVLGVSPNITPAVLFTSGNSTGGISA